MASDADEPTESRIPNSNNKLIGSEWHSSQAILRERKASKMEKREEGKRLCT